MIFLESCGGITDGAENVGVEICLATDVVDEGAGFGVKEEAVDGEVATLRVFLRGGEGDGLRAASVPIRAVGAESGDLDPAATGGRNDDDAEVGADELAAGEECGDLGWGGGGGDVVVLRFAIQQMIPDGAPGEEGLMASLVETVDDVDDVWRQGHGEERGLVGGKRRGKGVFLFVMKDDILGVPLADLW